MWPQQRAAILPHPNVQGRFAPDSSSGRSSDKDFGRGMWGRRWFSPYSMNPMRRGLIHSHSHSSIRSISPESIAEEEDEKYNKRRRIRNIVRAIGVITFCGFVVSIAFAVVYSLKNDRGNTMQIVSELKWNEQFKEEYLDASSDDYKNFVDKVQNAMYNTFSAVETYEGFDVISLSPGSVVISGIFYFRNSEDNPLSVLNLLTRNPSSDLKLSVGHRPTHLVIDANITAVAKNCNKLKGHHLDKNGVCSPCPIGSYGESLETIKSPCVTCVVCLPCPTNKTTMQVGAQGPNSCVELAVFTVDIETGKTFKEEYRNKTSTEYLSMATSLNKKIFDHISTSSASLSTEVILLRKSTSTTATVRITVRSSVKSARTIIDDDITPKLDTLVVDGQSVNVTTVGSVYTSADDSACAAGYANLGSGCAPCQRGWFSPAPGNCIQCPSGYTSFAAGSSECEEKDECSANPCVNGATCVDKIDDYSCMCPPGYTGNNCETDIDECSSSPCTSSGTCVDEVNGFVCQCPPEKAGVFCERDKTACDDKPCLNMATCSDDDSLTEYACTCVAGYNGINCETDIDECATNPCQNNGTCKDKLNAFECDCVLGYEGNTCEINIDDCDPDPCIHGSCTDGINDHDCTCEAGYNGKNCSNDIDDCTGVNCNNGVCEDLVDSYNCNCNSGYMGDACNQDVNECLIDSDGCEQQCNNTVGSYHCYCNQGYGLNDDNKTCKELNVCEKANPCAQPSGKCVPIGLDDYRCECSYCACSAVKLNLTTCHPEKPPCQDRPADGRYVAPEDCGKFISCRNGGLISNDPISCPDGQYFDEVKDNCERISDVPGCENVG